MDLRIIVVLLFLFMGGCEMGRKLGAVESRLKDSRAQNFADNGEWYKR